MSFISAIGAVELGLIYTLVTLGIFISYRILDIADLTIDGSFTLGASVSVIFTSFDMPIIGLFAGALAGTMAGFITAFLQTKLKVQSILAGIITMTALYSINIRIMGNKSNVTITNQDTIFTKVAFLSPVYSKIILLVFIILVVSLVLVFFFKTSLGLAVRATGDNKNMVSASSINPNLTIIVGLCMANTLVSLSGAIYCQYSKFSDVGMGIGTVVIALASLMIGEAIIGKKSISKNIVAVIVGSVTYRFIIAFALLSTLNQSDLKLISALILVIAITAPTLKSNFTEKANIRKNQSQSGGN